MTKPDRQFFRLVNTNADYIEFTVSYYVGADEYVVDGIGWMNIGKPKYYLRLLRLNSVPAAGKYFKQALLVEKSSSLTFRNKLLDALALSNIDQILRSSPTKK